MNGFFSNVRRRDYFFETGMDIIIALIIYHFFGFNVAVVVALAMINADIAFIMYRVYERVKGFGLVSNARTG